jgi:hypothetical protein
MIRNWPTFFALCGTLCLGIVLGNHGPVGRTEAKESVASTDSEIASLKSEIQILKDRVPDQAHAMQDVANQFTNVWFAGGRQHWDLANFYLGETRNHLRWAVRIIPKRKDNAGREVDLVSILKAMENGPLAQLEAVIKAKDPGRFVAAYKFTMENCYACHKAADKPYLRPQIPTEPATQIINFDPHAKWPL